MDQAPLGFLLNGEGRLLNAVFDLLELWDLEEAEHAQDVLGVDDEEVDVKVVEEAVADGVVLVTEGVYELDGGRPLLGGGGADTNDVWRGESLEGERSGENEGNPAAVHAISSASVDLEAHLSLKGCGDIWRIGESVGGGGVLHLVAGESDVSGVEKTLCEIGGEVPVVAVEEQPEVLGSRRQSLSNAAECHFLTSSIRIRSIHFSSVSNTIPFASIMHSLICWQKVHTGSSPPISQSSHTKLIFLFCRARGLDKAIFLTWSGTLSSRKRPTIGDFKASIAKGPSPLIASLSTTL